MRLFAIYIAAALGANFVVIVQVNVEHRKLQLLSTLQVHK